MPKASSGIDGEHLALLFDALSTWEYFWAAPALEDAHILQDVVNVGLQTPFRALRMYTILTLDTIDRTLFSSWSRSSDTDLKMSPMRMRFLRVEMVWM